MLEGRADQECPLGCFNEHTPSRGDRLPVAPVQVVVGRPSPHVLDVRRGRVGQVQHAPGRFAFVGSPGAVGFDFAACGAADAEVRVPEPDVARRGAGNVNLDLCNVSWRHSFLSGPNSPSYTPATHPPR